MAANRQASSVTRTIFEAAVNYKATTLSSLSVTSNMQEKQQQCPNHPYPHTCRPHASTFDAMGSLRLVTDCGSPLTSDSKSRSVVSCLYRPASGGT